MFWLYLHLVSWILLMIFIVLSLRAKGKRANMWEMSSRMLYLLIILSGTFMAFHSLPRNPIGVSIKILLGIAVIAIIEITFAKHNQKQASSGLYWLLAILILATALFGLILAHWFPFTLWF